MCGEKKSSCARKAQSSRSFMVVSPVGFPNEIRQYWVVVRNAPFQINH